MVKRLCEEVYRYVLYRRLEWCRIHPRWEDRCGACTCRACTCGACACACTCGACACTCTCGACTCVRVHMHVCARAHACAARARARVCTCGAHVRCMNVHVRCVRVPVRCVLAGVRLVRACRVGVGNGGVKTVGPAPDHHSGSSQGGFGRETGRACQAQVGYGCAGGFAVWQARW